MDRLGLLNLFSRQVFACRRRLHPDRHLMNPYLDRNEKHDPQGADNYATNRQSFLRAYISTLDATVMILGEAPGLDGCGFCGIAFTAEDNAVNDLGLTNFHQSAPPFQREDSATLVYAAMRQASAQLGVTFSAVAQKVFLTNTSLCVPLQANLTSTDTPGDIMKANCLDFLRQQIALVEPDVIIAIGGQAWYTLCD